MAEQKLTHRKSTKLKAGVLSFIYLFILQVVGEKWDPKFLLGQENGREHPVRCLLLEVH